MGLDLKPIGETRLGGIGYRRAWLKSAARSELFRGMFLLVRLDRLRRLESRQGELERQQGADEDGDHTDDADDVVNEGFHFFYLPGRGTLVR